jgi:sulfide:quinone oxidoreductase
MIMKSIVILGAGTAGTMMANKLRRKLSEKEWNIKVIDKNDQHYYQPGFIFIPFQLYGYHDLKTCKKPIRDLLSQGVEFIHDEIMEINTSAKKVKTRNNEVSYDWLITTTGVKIAPDEIPGLSEGYNKNVFYFYTPQSALDLQKPLSEFKSGKIIIEIAEAPIKCPVAPIEFAALADFYFRKKGLRKDVEIEVVTSQDSLFTKPIAGKILTDLFSKKEIKITAGFGLAEVDSDKRKIKSYDGKEISYDMLVSIPPNLGEDFYDDAGLGNGAGFVLTDQSTLKSIKNEFVYALGDCTNLSTSKAGSVAHFESQVAEHNLLREIQGKSPVDIFDGHALCFIETGFHKAHMIDFNYKQQPVTGKLPFPVFGPFSLLKETLINHWGKLGFRTYYWNFLLTDNMSWLLDSILPGKMSLRGKKL